MAGVKERAVLVLEDGTVYHGYAFGARGKTVGEVVFNTAQTGYQEIMTDPSYHGQIVVMTYPHQGNYGVNVYDMQSNRPWVRGFVAKEFSRVASNPRAQQTIGEFMEFYGVVGIEGIDTRALVRKIREGGVLKGTIAHASLFGAPDHAFTQEELEALRREAQAWTDIDGRDMTPEVSTPLPYAWPTLKSGRRIVVMDFGIKHAIVENLAALGFEVIVVPGKTPAHQIMALEPHGLLISNRRPHHAPLRPRDHLEAHGASAHLRHLPGAPASGPRGGRADLQDEVRPPGGEPPGEEPADGED